MEDSDLCSSDFVSQCILWYVFSLVVVLYITCIVHAIFDSVFFMYMETCHMHAHGSDPHVTCKEVVPMSHARKWSPCHMHGHGNDPSLATRSQLVTMTLSVSNHDDLIGSRSVLL